MSWLSNFLKNIQNYLKWLELNLNSKLLLKKDKRCLDHKCSKNSICTPETDRLSRNSKKYKCKCNLGYSGEFCEQDKSSCSRFNCMNNSTCVPSISEIGKFKCVCHVGFSGERCEINQVCLNVTCLNSGQCIAGFGNFTCMCGKYFSGRHCEKKDDELILLENVSSSISFFGIAIMFFYIAIFILMDIMRFCFDIEPVSLKEFRKNAYKGDLIKQIKKEKRMAIKRYKKINLAIQKMKQYHFLNVRFRSLKYIDASSTDTSINNVVHLNHVAFKKLEFL